MKTSIHFALSDGLKVKVAACNFATVKSFFKFKIRYKNTYLHFKYNNPYYRPESLKLDIQKNKVELNHITEKIVLK